MILFCKLQRYDVVSLFDLLILRKVDAILTSVQVQNERPVEALKLRDCADIVHSAVNQVVFLRLILIDQLLFVALIFKIDLDESFVRVLSNYILLHRLELVGVLTESIRVFCEVHFNVGNVANLVKCQDAENALFLNRCELTTLETQHVDIVLRGLIAAQFLPKQRNYSLDIAMHPSCRLLLLSTIVKGLLQDFWSANLRRAYVA